MYDDTLYSNREKYTTFLCSAVATAVHVPPFVLHAILSCEQLLVVVCHTDFLKTRQMSSLTPATACIWVPREQASVFHRKQAPFCWFSQSWLLWVVALQLNRHLWPPFFWSPSFMCLRKLSWLSVCWTCSTCIYSLVCVQQGGQQAG